MSQKIVLTEIEYKKLSLSFRKVASRFLKTNFSEASDNLERFLVFIEESPVIFEFIQENNTVEYDIENIINDRGYNDKFKLPVRESEEIAFIYQLLKYIFSNKVDYIRISLGYNSGRKYQEAVDNFNHQVVKPLVDHIVTYLGEMAIDMGLDKKTGTQFNITEFKGQLNHAEGEASITANQTFNESNIENLKEVSQKFIRALLEDENTSTIDKEETAEFLEAAIQETESEKPKKSIIKMAIEKVRNINEIATVGTTLYTLATQILPLLQNFIA